MSDSERERISAYESAYLGDYGFESVLVRFRHRKQHAIIERLKPGTIIEVGCGTEPLCERVAAAGWNIERWIIVEPAVRFLEIARSRSIRATIIPGFLEESVESVKAAAVCPPDLVLCAGVLHEIPDPSRMLRAIRSLCGPQTTVHVSVPNAHSLHRRLAHSMGLIGSVHELSMRNKALHQPRVYGRALLEAEVRQAGFTVEESGGYFVKFFTHAQMESLAGMLTDEMLAGLFKLGEELPEIAAEIFVNARIAQ